MGDFTSSATDAIGLGRIRELLAPVDVDDVFQMNKSGWRVLVEIGDHRTTTFQRRVHGGVVGAQSLLEERREERAVDQVVEHRRIGQVSHEIDLTVEQRLQLLEAHHERSVEARVLMQRR